MKISIPGKESTYDVTWPACRSSTYDASWRRNAQMCERKINFLPTQMSTTAHGVDIQAQAYTFITLHIYTRKCTWGINVCASTESPTANKPTCVYHRNMHREPTTNCRFARHSKAPPVLMCCHKRRQTHIIQIRCVYGGMCSRWKTPHFTRCATFPPSSHDPPSQAQSCRAHVPTHFPLMSHNVCARDENAELLRHRTRAQICHQYIC